jgi:hypothetical protein
MKKIVVLLMLTLSGLGAWAQSFELIDRQENYQSGISENVRIPIRIRNNSDKAQFYVIRKVSSDLGATQKGYFCLDKNCLESGTEEFSKRVEPGETLNGLVYTLETGLVSSQNNLRFEVFVKGFPHDMLEHNVSVVVEEKVAKSLIFKSKDITVHDIYPNPAVEEAFVEYQLHSETLKAKIVVHNVLGSPLGNYDLPRSDLKIKINTDEFPAGVYFYTLYLDNDGILTRKLIVRK